MYREGDLVFDKPTGKCGKITMVLADGVAVEIDEKIVVRFSDDVDLIPVALQYEDLVSLQHLAVETNDREWFEEISQRLGAAVSG